jgi:phosphatidylethanolamine/phosphatidyl-N-methylethanolamine N-methyltransferase
LAGRLDDEHIVAAYARWAPVYDPIFGVITRFAIRSTVGVINALPPGRLIEVGVGTGIALPLYRREHRITGIDLSADMLARAERRRSSGLTNVESLHEMDAGNLLFADRSFDIAVAMFVMTVVPDPARVMDEIVRVVRPGGRIVFANHFSADGGLRAGFERWLSRFSASLGWNPNFALDRVLGHSRMRLIETRSLPPFGLYTLLVFERV